MSGDHGAAGASSCGGGGDCGCGGSCGGGSKVAAHPKQAPDCGRDCGEGVGFSSAPAKSCERTCGGKRDDCEQKKRVAALNWGRLQAQSNPGMSDFWRLATIADTFNRATGQSLPPPLLVFMSRIGPEAPVGQMEALRAPSRIPMLLEPATGEGDWTPKSMASAYLQVTLEATMDKGQPWSHSAWPYEGRPAPWVEGAQQDHLTFDGSQAGWGGAAGGFGGKTGGPDVDSDLVTDGPPLAGPYDNLTPRQVLAYRRSRCSIVACPGTVDKWAYVPVRAGEPADWNHQLTIVAEDRELVTQAMKKLTKHFKRDCEDSGDEKCEAGREPTDKACFCIMDSYFGPFVSVSVGYWAPDVLTGRYGEDTTFYQRLDELVMLSHSYERRLAGYHGHVIQGGDEVYVDDDGRLLLAVSQQRFDAMLDAYRDPRWNLPKAGGLRPNAVAAINASGFCFGECLYYGPAG